jgi:hypothetical protein
MASSTFRRRAIKWGVAAAAFFVVLIAAAWISNRALSRWARNRAIAGLESKFGGNLEFKDLNVNVFPRFRITGDEIILHYRGRTDLPPLISIRRLSAESNIAMLFAGRVRRVRLEGLEITVPPKSDRTPTEKKSDSKKIVGFVIDEIVADGTVLRTLPQDPQKEPLVWDIRRLTLHDAGPNSPMSFRATLTNAKPPGDIESTGKFGPWATGEPGDTPVQGTYTFQNADLSVFKGIGGILSSKGNYNGILERIEAQGETDTPDFTVKVAGNPVHLTTQFHAIIDGTDGNTLLQPVNGHFGHSSLVAQGGVVGVKGVKGKTVSLDVTVEDGRLEDMLLLGVKGRNPTMTGAIAFRAKLVIPPGDVDMAEKMKLDGGFKIASAHFSKLNIQEKVNQLSHRGQGQPKEPASDGVASDFAGQFKLDKGTMTFRDLSFRVPGVTVALNGTYELKGGEMDFHGKAKLEAKLSQTVTGFKSFLLKAVDPFFRKKDAGAVIPIKITGTREQPSFGLDLHHGK